MAITTDEVIEAWRAALPGADVGSQTNFFACGGTSLTAAQIAAELSELTGRQVGVQTVFRNPSPAALVAALSQPVGQEETRAPRQYPAVRDVVPRPGAPVPLSEQQRAIWFQEKLSPGVRAYNCVSAVYVPTGLDPERLRAALRFVIDRHEVLRTTFPNENGVPVQVVHPRSQIEPQLSIDDGVSEDAIGDRLRELGQTPFDPARLPLISWVLFRGLERGGALFVQVEHHFVHDGWSTWLMLEEIAAHYRGAPLPPAERTSYRTFAAWQTRWISSPEAMRQRNHWVDLLRDVHGEVRFPRNDARPKVFSHRGASVIAPLAPTANDALTQLAIAVGTTPFSILHTVFGLLISAIAGVERFVIAVSCRNRRPEFSTTVGMFVNVVGVPFPAWRDRSFRDLATEVSGLLAAAEDNQEVPFSAVVRELRPTPQVTRNPIFQVCLSLNDWPNQWLDFGDAVTDDITYPGTGAKFDLDVVALPPQRGNGWRLLWRYYAEVLGEEDIREMGTAFDDILVACAEDPDAGLAGILEFVAPDRRLRV